MLGSQPPLLAGSDTACRCARFSCKLYWGRQVGDTGWGQSGGGGRLGVWRGGVVDNIINHQSIELHRFKLLPVRSVPSYPYGTDGETEVPRCLLSVIAHRNWSSYCSDCLSREACVLKSLGCLQRPTASLEKPNPRGVQRLLQHTF